MASSHLLCLYSSVCVGPGRKPRIVGFLMQRLTLCFRCNLASVVLQLLAMGISDIVDFDFMDKPSTEVGNQIKQWSLLMRKPTICIYENKDADQLRGNREADQRLCFRYTDSTLPVLPESETSSFKPASVIVQPDLCQTCSKTTLLVFSRGGSISLQVSHPHSLP